MSISTGAPRRSPSPTIAAKAPEGARPTSRQVYAAARAMADLLGVEWPEDRRTMSGLVADLIAKRDELAAVSTSDAIPF
jgi:hypothetical protein